MIPLGNFHAGVLGRSHEGDGWATEMGLAEPASGAERAMFTGRAAATRMPSRKQRCRGPRSVYHVW